MTAFNFDKKYGYILDAYKLNCTPCKSTLLLSFISVTYIVCYYCYYLIFLMEKYFHTSPAYKGVDSGNRNENDSYVYIAMKEMDIICLLLRR